MLKSALALALGLASSMSFAAQVRTDCASSGKEGVAQLHRDWLMIGWERNDGDPDFNFRKDLGKYYDFNSRDLNLFDDFDPELAVRHSADDYGKVWYRLVPKFKSVHHKITEQPGVVAVGPGYSHSVMEFVFEVTPKQGNKMHLISRSSILWRCTADGWKIFKEHNSARPVDATVYTNAN
jgi:ketosteroid isomerase-like protein